MTATIPAPAADIEPIPEAEVPAELRPYLRPLGGTDEEFVRHNVARNSRSYDPHRLRQAMHEQQLRRARAALEAEPRQRALEAVLYQVCPACGGPRAPLSRYQRYNPWTVLCGACEVEAATQEAEQRAREEVPSGATRAEAVARYLVRRAEA